MTCMGALVHPRVVHPRGGTDLHRASRYDVCLEIFACPDCRERDVVSQLIPPRSPALSANNYGHGTDNVRQSGGR